MQDLTLIVVLVHSQRSRCVLSAKNDTYSNPEVLGVEVIHVHEQEQHSDLFRATAPQKVSLH